LAEIAVPSDAEWKVMFEDSEFSACCGIREFHPQNKKSRDDT